MKVSGEREERRAEAIAHRATVIKAYYSGRSTARVADDWEVGRSWLEDRFREWGVPLRGPVKVAVLLLDTDDRIVLVKPATMTEAADERQAWRLPGGWTREEELITGAAARELHRETGVVRRYPQLAAAGFDMLPSNAVTNLAGGRRITFIATTLTATEAKTLAVPDDTDDVTDIALIPTAELAAHTRPYDTRRIRTTLTATSRSADPAP